MAEVKGKLCDCARCGKTVFLRLTNVESLFGGYDHANFFEDFPEGWAYHSDTGRLCPDCNAVYTKLINDFMPRKE